MPAGPKLDALQTQFMNWLLHATPDIQTLSRETTSCDKETRLRIYANAYTSRLVEALAENYPATHTLLGDDRFASLSRDYIQAYPSHFFSIRYFGHALAEHLKHAPDFRFQPVLHEMASFEWLLRSAFDAPDQATLRLEELQQLNPALWPELLLKSTPATFRLALHFNVPNLWLAIDANAEPIAAERSEQTVQWMIWRQDQQIYFRSLEAPEAWSIDRLMDGILFSELCEGLCRWYSEATAAQTAAQYLASWLEAGIIAQPEKMDAEKPDAIDPLTK